MRWVIRVSEPYESMYYEYCGSEQEVLEYLNRRHLLDPEDVVIEPEALVSYSPSEFKERYVN